MLAEDAFDHTLPVFCTPPVSLSKQSDAKVIPPTSLISGSYCPTSEPPPPDEVYTLAINPADWNPCQVIL